MNKVLSAKDFPFFITWLDFFFPHKTWHFKPNSNGSPSIHSLTWSGCHSISLMALSVLLSDVSSLPFPAFFQPEVVINARLGGVFSFRVPATKEVLLRACVCVYLQQVQTGKDLCLVPVCVCVCVCATCIRVANKVSSGGN